MARLPDDSARQDFPAIIEWIEPGSRVLDLGCGDGALLAHLRREKLVRGTGVDNDPANIVACARRGIPVVQRDLNRSLAWFEASSYDCVVVSQTIHQLAAPDRLVTECLRIGRRAIVSFPNFGHYAVRLQLLLRGRMPKSAALPYEWYRTPNIHLTTIADFEALCRELGVRILGRRDLGAPAFAGATLWPNLLSEGTVLHLGR